MNTHERRMLMLLLSGALALALVLVCYGALAPTAGHAAQTQTIGSYQQAPADQQTTSERLQPKDQKVPVQVWTIMAAGGAAALGLLLFFLRIALGRVPPPPPQEEAHH